MLTDQNMEKKLNGRSPSANSKGNSTESISRAKQDAVTKYPRTSRYKEIPSPRTDSARKPVPQKNRTITDKRPRTRNNNFERYRSEIAYTVPNGLDSLSEHGSKKVNLNHLLNFTLARSETSSRRCSGRPKLPKYNKELFLQANCQFIVRDTGNYTPNVADPDVLVDWDCIEEVHLLSHEVPSCPICLYPPIAAKITRCGHVYCWSCILHYLALTDKAWRKCPICYEAIHKADLKSVVSTTKTNHKVGDEITMCLLKRDKGSLFPLPAFEKNSGPGPFYVNAVSATTCFQKLLLAPKQQIYNIVKRERMELNSSLSAESDKPEVCFIESALQLLLEREEALKIEESLCSGHSDDIKDISHDQSVSENVLNCSYDEKKFQNYDNSSEGILERDGGLRQCFEDGRNTDKDLCMMSSLRISDDQSESSKKQGKECYFYQASDGQHIYLHTLNVHMLVKEYGKLEHCPLQFTAKILELEQVSMTEFLRKKLRYLQHLPLTCEFQVAELQLSPPIISEETVQEFSEEVNKRRHRRQKKAREDRRRDLHLAEEENRKLGKYPSANFTLDSLQHFPFSLCSDDPSFPSISNMPEEFAGMDANLAAQKAVSPDEDVTDSAYQTTSFAQMLREGKAKPLDVYRSKSLNGISQPVESESQAGSEFYLDSEEYVPAPEFHQSFSDAIQLAIDNISPQLESAGEPVNSKKKKKAKKTLLFTTSMSRSK